MKKTYLKPIVNGVEMEIESLLNIVSNGDGTQNAGGDQGDLTGDDEILSRDNWSDADWDDEF